SRNWGAEGDTNDEGILDARYRVMKNFMATLAFSQGVPMLAHGDEMARTQQGNNNAYAQDNELAWMNWELDDRRRDLLEFTRTVFAIRHLNPVLRRRTFFRGDVVDHSGVKDLTWLRPDGEEMREEDWKFAAAHALAMLIHGEATDEMDDRGRPIHGDTMVLLLNASDGEVRFTLPVFNDAADSETGGRRKGVWTELVNTARKDLWHIREGWIGVAPFSLVLLRYGRDRRVSVQGGDAAANAASVATAGEAVPVLVGAQETGGSPG
ncbi:MAG TPA: hypothetical protein VG106_11130, partial [Vicinamibacterales bacterium]|nr:hypothetical protein [Vicinamibacterales bacterium]